MKRRRKIIIRILIVLGIVIVICGIGSLVGLYMIGETLSSLGEWYSYEGDCLEWWGGPDDPAAIEQGANLRLPPSVDNLFAHSVAFQDCFVSVSFDMASNDLEEFLASTHVSALTPASSYDLDYFRSLMSDGVDWAFDDEVTYQFGSGSSNSGLESQYIIVDTTDQGRYAVYVITFLM
jgi:hypothetical protein